MTVYERFKSIRKLLRYNQDALGSMLNTNQPGITDIERGKKKPSFEIMEILHNKFQINLNWLICGSGKMRETESSLSDVNEPLPTYNNKQNEFKQLYEKIILGLERERDFLINKTSDQINAINKLEKELNDKVKHIELLEEKLSRYEVQKKRIV